MYILSTANPKTMPPVRVSDLRLVALLVDAYERRYGVPIDVTNALTGKPVDPAEYRQPQEQEATR